MSSPADIVGQVFTTWYEETNKEKCSMHLNVYVCVHVNMLLIVIACE